MSGKRSDMFEKLAQQAGAAEAVQGRPAGQGVVAESALPQVPKAPLPPIPEVSVKPVRVSRGKRDNPEYVQANAYLPKRLRRAVDRVLIDRDDLDYSTLVEDLLRQWLKAQGVTV